MAPGRDTSVPADRLKQLAARLTDIPKASSCTPRSRSMLAARASHGQGKAPVDWGMAENLAYASLVDEGYPRAPVGRTAAAAPSPTATRCSTTRTARSWDSGTYLPLQHILPENRRASS
jgi:2-oxoglutarate dehydrogenase E1 component